MSNMPDKDNPFCKVTPKPWGTWAKCPSMGATKHMSADMTVMGIDPAFRNEEGPLRVEEMADLDRWLLTVGHEPDPRGSDILRSRLRQTRWGERAPSPMFTDHMDIAWKAIDTIGPPPPRRDPRDLDNDEPIVLASNIRHMIESPMDSYGHHRVAGSAIVLRGSRVYQMMYKQAPKCVCIMAPSHKAVISNKEYHSGYVYSVAMENGMDSYPVPHRLLGDLVGSPDNVWSGDPLPRDSAFRVILTDKWSACAKATRGLGPPDGGLSYHILELLIGNWGPGVAAAGAGGIEERERWLLRYLTKELPFIAKNQPPVVEMMALLKLSPPAVDWALKDIDENGYTPPGLVGQALRRIKAFRAL